MFRSYIDKFSQFNESKKPGIVTSLNDTTLANVTYGKYATQVPDQVAYGPTSVLVPSKTLVSI